MGVPKDLIVAQACDFARQRAVPGTAGHAAQREGRMRYARSA